MYREEKRLNQLLRQACMDAGEQSHAAMQELRKVFYEAKHSLEALQGQPQEGRDYKELGRLTNLCKNIVSLFNDMGWGLHERRGSAVRAVGDLHAGASPEAKQAHQEALSGALRGRHYLGLGDEQS